MKEYNHQILPIVEKIFTKFQISRMIYKTKFLLSTANDIKLNLDNMDLNLDYVVH